MTLKKKLAIAGCAGVAALLTILVVEGVIAPLTAVLIAMALGGAALWAPKWDDVTARADVGSALVTTAAISAVFFGLSTKDEHKQAALAQQDQHKQAALAQQDQHKQAALAQQDQTKQQANAENEALLLALRTGSNLAGIDLTNQPLGKFDLGHKNLAAANLYGLNLSGGQLTDSDLDGASLNRADLVGTGMRRASMRSATMEGAKLDKANFNQADLTGAIFGISYQTYKAPQKASLINANFEDADLRGACLASATLTHANFEGADLRNANFDFAHLAKATFLKDGVAADVRGASFYGATLDAASRSFLVAHSAHLTLPTPPVVSGPASKPIATYVIAHSDGDTLKLKKLGWVRLLGVNAPDDTSPATALATGFIANKLKIGAKVLYLLGNPRREPRPDHLGRTLVYLWTPGGLFINEELLLRGLALRETDQHQVQPQYGAAFDHAQTYALEAGKGLWSYCPDYKANDLIVAK